MRKQPSLSDREQELLDLLAKGYTKAEAAREMDLSRQRISQLWDQLLNKGAINVVIKGANR